MALTDAGFHGAVRAESRGRLVTGSATHRLLDGLLRACQAPGRALLLAGRYDGRLVYWLAKQTVNQLAWAMAQELRPHGGDAVAVSPLAYSSGTIVVGDTVRALRAALPAAPDEAPVFVSRSGRQMPPFAAVYAREPSGVRQRSVGGDPLR